MIASNWLGCAESVLANSTQKLSVSEIIEVVANNNSIFSDHSAYTTLAAALFSEIQKPESKFLRSGNKFTLKSDDTKVAEREASFDANRGLSNRRRRRTPSNNTPSPELPPPVKLSTTTNPPGRTRLLSTNDNIILDNYNHQVSRRAHVTKINQMVQLNNTSSNNKLSCGKQVRFALDRTEIIYFSDAEELLSFPTC